MLVHFLQQVIQEESMDREVCQERLVGNLQDFLAEFSRNIDYENEEKRQALPNLKKCAQIQNREFSK